MRYEGIKKCPICERWKTDEPHVCVPKKPKKEEKRVIFSRSSIRQKGRVNLDIIEKNPERFGT